MEFYNREEELKMLKERYASLKRGELIIIYGRRRVGKTTLIERFLGDIKRGVYSYIDLSEKAEILKRLSEDFSEQRDTFLKFGDWDDVYEYIYRAGNGIVVVFDEFQRLHAASPIAITRLQYYWDMKLKDKPVMIILLGSSIGMMKKVAMDGTAPLYGRATMIYKLRPFRYADMRKMFKAYSEREKIRIYTVFGGTPYYLSIFHDKNCDLFTGIEDIVLRSGAILRDEVPNLLRMELKDVARYNSILVSIAHGKHTLKEISDSTGIDVTKLKYYIDVLKDLMDILEIRKPILGKKRTTKYIIKDNFFKFWYKYVFSNMSKLELGNYTDVINTIRKNIDTDAGFVFEDIARELLITYNHRSIKGYKLDISEIGSWWNRKGSEIDIVAINRNKLLLGEVKWGKVDLDIAKGLIEKSNLIKWHGEKDFIIFSGKGFTKRCERFMEKNNIMHIDIHDIEYLFDNM